MGSLFKHTGLHFHKVAYTRYDGTTFIKQTVYMVVLYDSAIVT